MDERSQSRRAVKAIRSAGDESRLVVKPLDSAIAQSCGDVRQDAVLEPLDGVRYPLERVQPGALRPANPAIEVPFGPAALAVVERLRETLLEQVCAVQSTVG